MAVTETTISSDLILVLDDGVGDQGKTLSKRRTYKNLRPQAQLEDILTVANCLINLQTRNKQGIRKLDTVEIEEII